MFNKTPNMALYVRCAKLPCAPKNTQEKAILQKTKVNTTKTRKVCADKNKPCNWERMDTIAPVVQVVG